MKAWMRILTITFTSTKFKKKITFGENYKSDKPDLNISVVLNKYMSPLKDSCSIRISNLTYAEILQLIEGEFYDVEIKAGYRTSKEEIIFKGGVLYISNSLGDKKTNTAIILCASNLVAKYGQQRLNLTLNSGINMYSAINFLCKVNKVPNPNISTQLKKQYLQEIINVNSNLGNWLETILKTNNSFIMNSDSITDSNLLVYDANKSNARVIPLTSNNIILNGGHPQLNKDGLNLSILPTFSFMCGDVIKIDNSILDIAVTNSSDYSQFSKGNFIDPDGLYTIYEMEYILENRGSDFSVNLICKSRSLISNVIGGNYD